MFIPSAELADLLSELSLGATPAEARQIEAVIHTIHQGNITARLDSPDSLQLSAIQARHSAYLDPMVLKALEETDIFGVDLPITNAIPRIEIEKGRRQVIVFGGLLKLIRYYTHLVHVLDLIQKLRSDKTVEVHGQTKSEAEAFSLAASALTACFVRNGDALPEIDDLLGPVTIQHARNGFESALLFIMIHELGHLMLGHTKQRHLLSERRPVSLALPEEINAYQQDELEADAYAAKAILQNHQEDFVPGILFFVTPFAFLEAFGRDTNSSHPLFVNRGKRLAELLCRNTETASIVSSIIQPQIDGFWSLRKKQFEAGGDIHFRIQETMPAQTAWQLIEDIKSRIRSENGFLEGPL